MIRKWQIVVCREGLYYLLVLAFVVCGALMREINLLMIVAGMMIGPMLYNVYWVFASLGGVRLQRRLPEGICAGDLLVVDLALANPRKRRAASAIVVQDRVSRESAAGRRERATAGVLFAQVPPGQTRHATYSGRLAERGRYRFGPLTASTRFPLGLVRRSITQQVHDELTVFPRLGRLTAQWSRLHYDVPIGSRSMRRQPSTLEGDFLGMRDWRPGDARRWIHWRTSARRGSLIVRQFEQPRSEDLLLLVDLWQPRSPTPVELDHVESAVSFAATAVADLCRRGGCQLSLGVAGGQISFHQGVASTILLNEIMEELAVVQASSQDRLGPLVARGLERVRPGTIVVIVSTRAVDPARFSAELPEETAGRLSSMRIISIDVGSEQLAEYFHAE